MIDPEEYFIFTNPSHKGSVWVADWIVPKDLPYFDGHFPNQPVLPGVGIIDGSLCAVKVMGHSFSKAEVKRARFSKVIVPEVEIQIEAVQVGGNTHQVTWTKKDSGEVFAKVELICQ